MSAWSPYAVAKYDPSAGFQNDRKRFSSVGHTSHVESAIEIVRKGEIRAGLVFDKSMLNDRRILVAWMSPNSWAPGYRYGNIKFDLDFKSLIEGKQFFWVEVITEYNPPAPRILITNQDRTKDGLQPYDPEADDGPWLYDRSEDQHYYNGSYTLEFMFEGDVSLADVTTIDFVKHHNDFCSVSSRNPRDCKFLGADGARGGARFVARCVASGISLENHASSFLSANGQKPSDTYAQGLGPIFRLLYSNDIEYEGNIDPSDDLADPIARAFLHAFSYGRPNDARLLAGQFEDPRAAEQAVAELLAAVVGLDDWKALIE